MRRSCRQRPEHVPQSVTRQACGEVRQQSRQDLPVPCPVSGVFPELTWVSGLQKDTDRQTTLDLHPHSQRARHIQQCAGQVRPSVSYPKLSTTEESVPGQSAGTQTHDSQYTYSLRGGKDKLPHGTTRGTHKS